MDADGNGRFASQRTISIDDATIDEWSTLFGRNALKGCIIGRNCKIEADIGKNNHVMDGSGVAAPLHVRDEALHVDPEFLTTLEGM